MCYNATIPATINVPVTNGGVDSLAMAHSTPDTVSKATHVDGVTSHANPVCQCSCGCRQIVRRSDCVFCNFCIENHVAV
ncbi:hypothetical protein BKA56DRAFT_594164 [Ilyonectria sp. MPI-CAGE-AT-0026]|nr:hypothetical protein BKA56DRAFT_594164 [Ilyonectria sp. MPI-CAGE-AT-0026]